MGGCLGLTVRLLALGVIFLMGMGLGLGWWTGSFDAPIVDRAMEEVRGLDTALLQAQVSMTTTVDVARDDPARVDGHRVLWRGTIVEYQPLVGPLSTAATSSLSALRIRSGASSEFVAFYKKGVGDVHLDLEVEVLGVVRQVWVLSRDRSGHRVPQVLAVLIRPAGTAASPAPPGLPRATVAPPASPGPASSGTPGEASSGTPGAASGGSPGPASSGTPGEAP